MSPLLQQGLTELAQLAPEEQWLVREYKTLDEIDAELDRQRQEDWVSQSATYL